VASEISKRDKAKAPHIGERIRYVIIAGSKGMALFEKAVDPLLFMEKGWNIDINYYLEKQIKPPLLRILEHVFTPQQCHGLFAGEHTKKVFTPSIKSCSGLNTFVQVIHKCQSCKKDVRDGEAVCTSCRAEKGVERALLLPKLHQHSLI